MTSRILARHVRAQRAGRPAFARLRLIAGKRGAHSSVWAWQAHWLYRQVTLDPTVTPDLALSRDRPAFESSGWYMIRDQTEDGL